MTQAIDQRDVASVALFIFFWVLTFFIKSRMSRARKSTEPVIPQHVPPSPYITCKGCGLKFHKDWDPVDWRPIESAKMDGTEVLLYFPHRDLVIRGSFDWQGEGDWEMGIADWRDWNTDDDVVIQEDPTYAPTLWMPIPSPEAHR